MSDMAMPSDAAVKESSSSVQPGLEAAFAFSEIFGSEEIKKSFMSYIVDEMQKARDNETRKDYLDNLLVIERQVQARPATEKKDWPWPGAANVCPPLTFKKGNTIYSKLLSNYDTKRPFWSVESATMDYAKNADALGKLLNFFSKSPFHLNLKSINRRAFWNVVFKGTQFYEVAWDMQKAPVTNEGAESGQFRYKKNSPVVNLIDIENFLTRADWTDIQSMPWCGIHVRYSWAEIQNLKSLGIIATEEDLVLTEAGNFNDNEKKRRDLARLTGDFSSAYDQGKYFDLYKFWAFYDVKGDGNVVDVQGIIDIDTGALLRCEVNPLSYRLVGKIVYYEIPGQLYGLGVGHILQYLQDEIETIHNQRLDATFWAMLPQWKAKSGSQAALNINPRPGEVHVVDDMEDLAFMATPDVSASSYQAEEITERYADQATGANEAMAGRADPTLKSGGGAEAQMVLMQTGSSVLNTSLDTVDEYYAQMGPMLVLLMRQNASFVSAADYLTADEAALVDELLAMPITDLPGLFKFSIETTDLARNEGSRREDLAGFMALYTNYFSEMTQLYGAYQQSVGAGDQFQAQMFYRGICGKTEIMNRMAEYFHIGNPTDYIMSVDDVKKLLGGENGTIAQPGSNAPAGEASSGGASGGMAISGAAGASAAPGAFGVAQGSPGVAQMAPGVAGAAPQSLSGAPA